MTSKSKRSMDLVLGSAALLIAVPMMAGIALLMRLSGDDGPFLYRAPRVGEGGRVITVLKIRTMSEGATGSRLTSTGDSRITRIGGLLRRVRIDELPQLINVVRGEMSLVGPRPEDPMFVDFSDPMHRRVFTARPGITGLAQLEFHDEARLLSGPDSERIYREVVLPAKLRLDAAYLDQRTTMLDLKILARTALTVLDRGSDEAADPAAD
jgi:lipopolysaccharide/colanic/teichoic acid biosynthesis glycosyltransferase